jgi:hypothetical protein
MYVHIVMQDSCVIGAWTSPVDAAEHAKRFARACVVKYRCNSGKEPCVHEWEPDERFHNERATSTCRLCGEVL